MFRLFENELNTISAPSTSIHWTFFGVTIGAAITLGVSLSTGGIPVAKMGTFTATFWCTTLLAVYFLVMGIHDYAKAKNVLREIKKRPEPS